MKIILLALLVASCSSKPAKDAGANSSSTVKKATESKTVSMESKQLASEQESKFVTEITFPKEKSNLSKAAKEDLNNLYQKAAKKGKIHEVQVITWGDQEYPSVHEKRLSEKQIKLVEKRNKTLENYLIGLTKDLADVETHSMAERPGTLNRLFASEDARIKKSLETAGIPNTDTSVKVPGKASKSVVIFIMEEE